MRGIRKTSGFCQKPSLAAKAGRSFLQSAILPALTLFRLSV